MSETLKKTELVFILDRSGSMSGLESDTIGGFNSMIRKQQKETGEAWVTTVLFDNTTYMLHDRITLNEVSPMTEAEYYVGGCTALLDAVGETIKHISNIHKYVRSDDIPNKTLVVIITDGQENASHHYNYQTVSKMIEKQKAQGREFIFLGANIDAAAEAGKFGIHPGFAADYNADPQGTMLNFEVINEAVCNVRMGAGLNEAWKKAIDEDYAKRGCENESD